MRDRPNIFLLTDFGTADHYVAVMKSVILTGCPDANFVDISHEVPAQAVETGAYLLESTWPWLPEGAIVLAVVDPGVGTSREPAVFYSDSKILIGPNNGLFGFLPTDTAGRVLDVPLFWNEKVSGTFHGRDVFAPCTAFVAAGGHWSRLGMRETRPVQVESRSGPGGGMLTGRIIHFDHFGNAITSIRADGVTGATAAEIAGSVRCPVVTTYGDVEVGSALAYAGSTGRIEIAVRDGNARQKLGLQLNDSVSIEPGVSHR